MHSLPEMPFWSQVLPRCLSGEQVNHFSVRMNCYTTYAHELAPFAPKFEIFCVSFYCNYCTSGLEKVNIRAISSLSSLCF